MNERIRALTEQAGIFKPKEFYQHIDDLQLEKFAELIVEKCISIVANKTWGGGDLAIRDMKEHFGVSE